MKLLKLTLVVMLFCLSFDSYAGKKYKKNPFASIDKKIAKLEEKAKKIDPEKKSKLQALARQFRALEEKRKKDFNKKAEKLKKSIASAEKKREALAAKDKEDEKLDAKIESLKEDLEDLRGWFDSLKKKK